MDSIIQKEKCCFVCGTTFGLHSHHIFFGNPNRSLSEKYGLKCYLCVLHHTGSNDAVHKNRDLDLFLKITAQQKYEATYGTREDFIKTFGRSYL
jgi:hypothetical protein